jgi:hypothetical protein
VIDDAHRHDGALHEQPRCRDLVTAGPGTLGLQHGAYEARRAGAQITLDDITNMKTG